MIALWILGGLAALFAAICCIRVGVTAEYSDAGPSVVAHAGPVRIQLFPKQPGEKPEKPKKKKKKTQPESAQQEKKRGGSLPLFRQLIALVLEAQAEVRNRLRIRELTLCLTVGGRTEDPAKSAVLYGRAWTALGNLMPLLHRAFRIEKQDVRAEIDFLSEKTSIYAKATAVISVGAILRMAGYYGIRGLKLYRAHQKKGGKKHGTSNQ